MTNRHTMRKVSGFGVLLLAACYAPVAKADTTYTYTGHDFTTVSGSYTTSNFVSGSVTVSNLLPLNNFIDLSPCCYNLPDYSLISYSFTDGQQTVTELNSGPRTFFFVTDGTGIQEWDIRIQDALVHRFNKT